MSENEANVELAMGDQQLSLADIAGIDMDDVQEVRRFVFPTALCQWKCDKAELKLFGKEGEQNFAVTFDLVCEDVLSVADKNVNTDALVGKKHTEFAPFNKTDPVETIGRAKAFMSDAGFKGKGKLGEVLEQFAGTRFGAKINQFAMRNDTDRKGASIGLMLGDWRIVPLEKIKELTEKKAA